MSDLEQDPGRAREFVPAVAAELPRHLADLRGAIADNEYDRVGSHARRLANLFCSLLAADASDAARRLAAEAGRRRDGEMRLALRELELETDRLLADLTEAFGFPARCR